MDACEPVSHATIRPLLPPRARVAEGASRGLEVLSSLHLVSSPFPASPLPLTPSLSGCPPTTFLSHPQKVHEREKPGVTRNASASHGRRTLRRRDDQLRRQQEPRAARRRHAPQGACPRRARAAVLAAHHRAGPAPPRSRDRHVLRAAGHGAPDGPGPGRPRAGAGAGARDGAGGGGQGRGGAARRGEEGAEAVRAADVPGGRRHVQPRGHVHGRRRRVLPLQLANGGKPERRASASMSAYR
jgi:hypothetical protein